MRWNERLDDTIESLRDKPLILSRILKWQMDVLYGLTVCYSGQIPQKIYQYTIIDEASRERFIYPYMEQGSYSNVDFVNRAVRRFGYRPQIIQTDNAPEFTHWAKTNRHFVARTGNT